jgi:hypothetical protein
MVYSNFLFLFLFYMNSHSHYFNIKLRVLNLIASFKIYSTYIVQYTVFIFEIFNIINHLYIYELKFNFN